MDEEKQLLFEQDTESDAYSYEQAIPHHNTPKRKFSWILNAVVPSLLAVSLITNIFQALQHSSHTARETIFPELRYIRQQTVSEHPEHGVLHSDFQGPPSNTTSAAWTNLLQPFYFNVSTKELSAAGISPSQAVRVKNGGYLASLGVYHELHCLNQLRNFLYLNTAAKNFPKKDDEYWHGHLDHCIEVLRLSVMCAADVSLYTFEWPREHNFTFLDAKSTSERQCVDWSEVEGWGMKRKVDLVPTVLFLQD